MERIGDRIADDHARLGHTEMKANERDVGAPAFLRGCVRCLAKLGVSARCALSDQRATVGCLLMCTAVPAAAHGALPVLPSTLWRAWSFYPGVVVPLLLATVLYVRGMVRMRAHRGRHGGRIVRQTLCFGAGAAVLVVALLSPLDRLGDMLLSAHMVQHGLLITAAPLLLLAGRPGHAFGWALSAPERRAILASKAWRGYATSINVLSRPLVAAGLHGLALWSWHAPALFGAALANDGLHLVEHATFFGTALLFWRAMLDTRSTHRVAPAVGALFATLLFGGLLGALITMSPQPLYTWYVDRTQWWGISALEDQQLAGLLMWVPLGVIYSGAALVLASRFLTFDPHAENGRRTPLTAPGRDGHCLLHRFDGEAPIAVSKFEWDSAHHVHGPLGLDIVGDEDDGKRRSASGSIEVDTHGFVAASEARKPARVVREVLRRRRRDFVASVHHAILRVIPTRHQILLNSQSVVVLRKRNNHVPDGIEDPKLGVLACVMRIVHVLFSVSRQVHRAAPATYVSGCGPLHQSDRAPQRRQGDKASRRVCRGPPGAGIVNAPAVPVRSSSARDPNEAPCRGHTVTAIVRPPRARIGPPSDWRGGRRDQCAHYTYLLNNQMSSSAFHRILHAPATAHTEFRQACRCPLEAKARAAFSQDHRFGGAAPLFWTIADNIVT
jgi:putative membrane protein